MSLRDQVLMRLGERKSIRVVSGSRLERNLWTEFNLPEINITVLFEEVDAMRKDGLVSVIEGSMTRTPSEGAGISRDVSVSRERIYELSEAGQRAYQQLLAERTDMP